MIGSKRSGSSVHVKRSIAPDLVILLLNASEPLTTEDIELLQLTQDKKRIIVLNKMDLEPKLDLNELYQYVDKAEVLKTSVLKK